MQLTAVVPFFNGHATIDGLLNSLPGWLPVVVVDDHSDKAPSLARRNVQVIRPEKKGYFAGAVNAAIETCTTDVLVLNQDAWLDGHKWQELVMGWQSAGVGVGGDGVMKHPAWPKGYVQGTFMFMSREAINVAGLLNARDYPLWGATAEWQLRVCRKGFKAAPVSPVPGLKHRKKRGYGSSIKTILEREPHNQEWLIRTPPMISVIVPCYNYARYLEDAVNSLIGGPTDLGEMPGQTFQSFEIIIVNDGSQDETHEVASALADGWKGIRYINLPENQGLPRALNTAISRAYGEYISILSADDMREPWHYETFYRAMEGNKKGFVYGDIMLFRDGQRYKVYLTREYDFEYLLLNRNIAGAGILYHKSAWEQVGGYPTAMKYGREDWAFNIALGLNGHYGRKVQQQAPSNLYRREKQNRSYRTRKFSVKTFHAQIKALWPGIYAGERPVTCCGGRARGGGGSGRPASKVYSLPGKDGLTRLEYIGQKVGSTTWRGDDGRLYVFGNNDHDRVKFVDNRDVKMLLGLREKRKPIFRRYKPKSPVAQLTPEQKEIANPVLPAKEEVAVSPALAEAAEGLPQDDDLLESSRVDGVLDVHEQLDIAESLINAHAGAVLATAKAKIEAFKLKVDLALIEGTGRGGQITVGDVRAYANG